MKTIRLMLFAGAFAAMVSCNKTETRITPPADSDEKAVIELTFSAPRSIESRGFFEDVEDVPASVENRMDVIDIFIFDSNGQQAYTTRLLPHGASRFITTLEIPKALCGTTCTIYTSANTDIVFSGNSVPNYYYQSATGFPHAADSYLEIIDPTYWVQSKHFIMSATEQVEIKPYGLKTYVPLELKRVEAKVALRLKVADNFPANHNGATLDITGVQVKNLPNSVYIFSERPYESWNRSQTQTPYYEDGYYHNLFYLFPRGITTNPVNIVISAVYDYDGDPVTTGDRTPVAFNLPVSPDGTVERNTFYRIDGIIKGVGKMNLDFGFSVKDWTRIDNNVEIGG